MSTLLNDLRYGAKMLLTSKGVTVVAMVSLAIGVGANSAIFSLVNSTRDRGEVFTGLAAYSIQQFKLGGPNGVEEIIGEAVSGNYFDVLGVVPYKGRTFSADEDLVPRKNPVAVVGYDLWQRRFNSDPELVGKTITLNAQPLTVIGIAPPQYTGMIRGLGMDVWIPTMMVPAMSAMAGDAMVISRGNRWLMLVGRLKPETTLAQARARFDLFTRDMQAAHPEEWLSNRENGSKRELSITVLPERKTSDQN